MCPGGMCSAHYDYPRSSIQDGFHVLDVSLTIEVAPRASSYYWAHQFWFVGGNGGYMGLQTGGLINGVNRGKIAIFSIWDAVAAESDPPASVERFTGEGDGWSCRLPYDWEEATPFRLRLSLAQDVPAPSGDWWECRVAHVGGIGEALVGRIQVPAAWRHLQSSSLWFVEYFGEVSGCDAIPFAEATFGEPMMDDGISPKNVPQIMPYGVCAHLAKVTEKPGNCWIAETGTEI